MQFGTKRKDAAESVKGSGNYLRNFKNGSVVVRFLEEPSEWLKFYEHYNTNSRSFPCTEEDSCPGCASPVQKVREAKTKYATQIYLVEQKRVLPFRVPVSVADKMVNRAEKNDGRITTRDYAIMRSGAGLDTEYDVDSEDRYPLDVEDLLKSADIDIQDCLNEAYKDNSGDSINSVGEEPQVSPGDKGWPEADFKQTPKEEVYSEADIRAMSKSELRSLCQEHKVDFDDDDSARELADRLVSTFGA